jgi:hypothetical protein
VANRSGAPPPAESEHLAAGATTRGWCALNGFSESTGRRIIAAGKVRVTQLSDRRIGIGEDDNADFQAACARGGA